MTGDQLSRARTLYELACRYGYNSSLYISIVETAADVLHIPKGAPSWWRRGEVVRRLRGAGAFPT